MSGVGGWEVFVQPRIIAKMVGVDTETVRAQYLHHQHPLVGSGLLHCLVYKQDYQVTRRDQEEKIFKVE